MDKTYHYELDELYIVKTYAGCLEGIPPRSSVLKAVKRDAEYIFGKDIPLFIIEPEKTGCNIGKTFQEKCSEGTRSCIEFHMLPQYRFIVLVQSYTAVKEGDGSHLLISFFKNEPYWEKEALNTILKDVDWGKNAKDYWI